MRPRVSPADYSVAPWVSSPGDDLSRSARRALLFIAHPGHELMLYGWLEGARPVVCVLTDGSGRTGRSRLWQTSDVLAATGSRPGPVFGRFTDQQLHEAFLRQDAGLFLALASELGDFAFQSQIECIVTDAVEGFNPVHDVMQPIAGAAVQIARQQGEAAQIELYDYPVVRSHGAPAEISVRMDLGDEVLQRKLSAAYRYDSIRREVDASIRKRGIDSLRTESLRLVPDGCFPDHFREQAPEYETTGEARVALGIYDTVIRYRDHVLPIVRRLEQYAEECKAGSSR